MCFANHRNQFGDMRVFLNFGVFYEEEAEVQKENEMDEEVLNSTLSNIKVPHSNSDVFLSQSLEPLIQSQYIKSRRYRYKFHLSSFYTSEAQYVMYIKMLSLLECFASARI